MRVCVVLPSSPLLRRDRANPLLSLLPGLTSRVDLSLVAPRHSLTRSLAGELGIGPEDIHLFPDLHIAHKNLGYFVDFHPGFRQALLRASAQVDLFHVLNPWGSIAAASTGVPTITQSYNVEGEFIFHAEGFWRGLLSLLYPYINLQEQVASHRSTRVAAISGEDRAELKRRYRLDDDRVEVLPPPAPSTALPSRAEARRRLDLVQGKIYLLFHGSSDHRPNREAFDFLRGPVASWLALVHPAVTLLLVGSELEGDLPSNVSAPGFVPDLSDVLAAADAAVVPIRRGGGVRIKLLDYMAAGLPIVLTPRAAMGIRFEDGVNSMIVSNRKEFQRGISALIEDAALRARIGAGARRLAESEHSLDAVTTTLLSIWTNSVPS